MRTRIDFTEVALTGRKSGKCGCGKYRARSTKFWQTLNPFNKNDDGTVKTRNQILVELDEERKQWKAEPITCEACKQPSAALVHYPQKG